MGVYGGLLVNFSPWMRSWLIWSLTIGSTAALALGRIVWQKRSPGFAGAALGLLVLAGGMSLSHYNTMNWPFWSLLNTVEFNWFAAPQHWQLAPPRFLMGFGSGMVLLAMTTRTSPDPLREARIRPLLQVAQFAGGTLSVGVLVTVLLAAHQLQYSYVADRGFIQAVERGDRNSRLAAHLATAGAGAAARQAEALEFRAVNYEADNLVFATIYGGFLVASLVLGRRLRRLFALAVSVVRSSGSVAIQFPRIPLASLHFPALMGRYYLQEWKFRLSGCAHSTRRRSGGPWIVCP